jgi:hypothetical protein
MSKTISAGRTPKIEIETIDGDLSLVGWEGEDILLKADDEEMRLTQDGDLIRLSCNDDLSLRLPKGASISIQKITGGASIRGVVGGLQLGEVSGDLSIRDVNNISVDIVHGDFSLRGAKGNLALKKAEGHVSIRDVTGNVSLDSIVDDLALRDVKGNVNANVAEDIVLYLNPQAGNAYVINAGDDILLVMPPKANATLTLSADRIEVDWEGVVQDKDATSRVITLGDGSATMTLSAGGDIRVSNRSDAGDSAEDFGNFAGVGMDWSGFGAGFGEKISRRVEQATARAHRKVEEAARRMEHKARDAERQGRRFKGALEIGRWKWDLGSSSKGVPMPTKSAISDEERLVILKMLQEKKITAEQAEKLLASLEGGS